MALASPLEIIMTIRKSDITILGIILLCLVVSFCLYAKMPEKIASHWNAKGQVDGYMSKSTAVFLMPVIMVVTALLFKFIPKIDPLKIKYERFRNYYDGFVIVFLLFLLGMQYFMLLWNIGIKLSLNAFMPIGIGLLFFFTGSDNWKTILFFSLSTSTCTVAPSLNVPPSNSIESGLSTFFWIALRNGRAPNAGS